MSAQQHTSGQWMAVGGGAVEAEQPGERSVIVAHAYSEEEAGPAEQRANARLIAAAPDLLAAAKRAYVGLTALNPHSGDRPDSVVAQLRAAIAKAEGREP